MTSIHRYSQTPSGVPYTSGLCLAANINRLEFLDRVGGRVLVLHVPLRNHEDIETALLEGTDILENLWPTCRRTGVADWSKIVPAVQSSALCRPSDNNSFCKSIPVGLEVRRPKDEPLDTFARRTYSAVTELWASKGVKTGRYPEDRFRATEPERVQSGVVQSAALQDRSTDEESERNESCARR